jgi:hypothetical protein
VNFVITYGKIILIHHFDSLGLAVLAKTVLMGLNDKAS